MAEAAEVVSTKPGLITVLVGAVIAVVLLVFCTAVVWALGLIMGVAFGVIGSLFLFFVHKIELVDARENKILWVVPFVLFFLGYGADRLGVLSIQPFSFTDSIEGFSLTFVLVIVVALLAAVVVVVEARDG